MFRRNKKVKLGCRDRAQEINRCNKPGILDRDAGLRGLLARCPGAWGPAQRLKCWSEDGNPPKVSGLGVMVATQQEVKNMACRKSKSGGIQAPGACGPGLQGAWGPGPQGLGPGPPLGPFPHKNHPNLSNYDFFANLLVGAWRRRGCRLKRLLRRWGPGGKRSRDTPPTPPYPALPPPAAFWGCKGERKRVFTLSAFGNHPTRPPRSADRLLLGGGST